MHFRRVRAALPSLALVLLLTVGCGDDGPNKPDDHNHGDPTGQCGHVLASGVSLVSHGEEYVHEEDETIVGELTVRVGGLFHGIEFHALDSDGKEVAMPAQACTENVLDWEIANPAIATLEHESGHKWMFNLRGLAVGETTMKLRPLHETHWHYETQPIRIVVTQ